MHGPPLIAFAAALSAIVMGAVWRLGGDFGSIVFGFVVGLVYATIVWFNKDKRNADA